MSAAVFQARRRISRGLRLRKPKRDRWLTRHPHVHLHFIPTHASWPNLVELWFSILTRHPLHGLSCTHARQLWDAIDRFVCSYRETAAPFEWTKTEVHPSKPKVREL